MENNNRASKTQQQAADDGVVATAAAAAAAFNININNGGLTIKGRRSLLDGRGGGHQGRISGGRNAYGRRSAPVGRRGNIRGITTRDGIPEDCATSNYPRLIHDKATWKFLQDTYYDTVNNSNGYSYNKRLSQSSGFMVDIIVKDDGYRGRSVYANQFIKKGTKIWNSIHLVSFKTSKQLKTFLSAINNHDLQCDALLWAYVEKGEGYVSLALDDGSFVNHGESTDVINLDKDCVAVRDIQIGEELLENYTEFIGFKEIKWFDEIRGNAWKEPSIDGDGGDGSLLAKSTDTYNKFGAPKMNGIGGGGGGWDSSSSSSRNAIDYYSDINNINPNKALMVLLPTVLMIGAFVYIVVKKLFPYHIFKKEKEGI